MNITTWREAYEAWDEWLDDVGGDITVLGMTFLPSDILRNCDPVAYRCGFNDWADGLNIDTDELTGNPERH